MIKGFGDKIIGAPLDGCHGGIDTAVSRHHHHGLIRCASFDGCQQFQPIHSRHLDIRKHQIKRLVDDLYPQAERITLVMDNLNTHTGASLYKAFSPEEARRILDKLNIHYTPKHGS